jgi:hypothetical protein
MTPHLDVLARLHVIGGAFGVLTGASLAVLAAGTAVAWSELGLEGPAGPAAGWLLLLPGLALATGGILMAAIGRGLLRRAAASRPGALLLAVPTLLVVPFGTALGLYAFWVLLNEDVKAVFGRRSTAGQRPGSGRRP